MVQLLYFPMPIREGVGTETLDGSISVEGYSLDSTRSHHHQSSVQQPQHRHTKEQLQNFLNRPLTYGFRCTRIQLHVLVSSASSTSDALCQHCDVRTVSNRVWHATVTHSYPLGPDPESAWKLLCSCLSNDWSRRGSASHCIPMLVF